MAIERPFPTQQEMIDLVEQIRVLLDGKGPELQGAALADIVSMFFAGHNPQIREQVIDNWIWMVRELIPINEAPILALGGWDRKN